MDLSEKRMKRVSHQMAKQSLDLIEIEVVFETLNDKTCVGITTSINDFKCTENLIIIVNFG